MISTQYCQTMAEYNHWMNQKLYKICDTLAESELQQDRGLFFNSIYGTLNHLMFGDIAWLCRLQGQADLVPDIGVELYSSYNEMREARSSLDAQLIAYAAQLHETELNKTLTFVSKGSGQTLHRPMWVVLTHMFNHQTHHREQITTALTQMGIDFGVTDLAAMPSLSQLAE